MKMVELTYQIVLSTLQTAGLLVGIFYYIMTLQNAAKGRKLQLAQRMLTQIQSEENSLLSLELLEMRWDDINDFEGKYDSTINPENYAKRQKMFGMYTEAGYFLKKGLIDVETVFDLNGGHSIFLMWNKFKPVIIHWREKYDDPNWLRWFEYAANEMRKERVRRGLPAEITDADGYTTT